MADVAGAELVLLAGAAFAAGAINAVAGGGSLVSFPALVGVGLSPLSANVTNQLAVLPGYVGGSLAYRRELAGQRRRIVALAGTSAAGALAGAAILLASPERTFEAIVPFLVLLATALLAAQPWLSRRFEQRAAGTAHRSAGVHGAVFAASVYGGYFGAGLGLVLLAVLALLLPQDLQRLNALKGILSLAVGAAAAVLLALLGPVVWEAAAIMAAASLAGGQLGVALARRLTEDVLRWGVVVLGVAVSIWLFLDQ